jgi:hypothetical protein
MTQVTLKEAVMRKAIFIVSLGLLCLLLIMWGCERLTTGGSGSATGQISNLTISAGDTVLAAPAGVVDSTTITITVTDEGGNGVAGQFVELYMDNNVGVLTALSPGDTTDFSGQVSTTFRVNQHFGTNTIHAQLEGIASQMQITVRRVDIAQVTLQVSPAVLTVAPGASGQATLKVWVRDQDGNGVAYVKPALQSPIGIIENYGRTNTSGYLETTFHSAGDSGTAVITASVGAISGTASITVNQTASATGTIELQTDLNVIYADNQVTSAHVSALLKDSDHQVIRGDTVIFTSSVGAISSPIVTDSLGIARTIFTDNNVATEPDSAMVIAQYRPFGIADTIYIMILEQREIDHIDLVANPSTLTAGVDSSTVTATVYQVGETLAPEGTQIIFDSDSGGTFTPNTVGMLNQSGQATVYFHAPSAAGVTHLTATASGVVSNELPVSIVPGPVRRLEISVTPNILYTSSTATAAVAVQVMDSLGNNVRDGLQIAFTSSLGIISPPFASTLNGFAYASLSPGNTAGLAMVKASCQGYADSTTAEFIAGGPSNITLASDRNFIQVAGVGGPEQAHLTATIHDAMGNSVENGWPVYFEIVDGQPGGGVNINNQGLTDTAYTINGAAIVTLNSGVLSGPVLIRASTYTDSTQTTEIFALKSGINIGSGPPNIVIVGHNDAGADAGGGSWIIDVHAALADIYSNPVDDSIAVFFQVVPDTANIVVENVYTGNSSFSGGSPVPGTAFTQLQYPGTATFEDVTVIARAAVPGGAPVQGSQTFALPMQDCVVTLYIQPAAWHFGELGDPTQIECRAVVHDGHGTPINNALVLFFTTKGRFYTSAVGGQQVDERLTGQPPDPFGQATLWLRAQLQFVFLDPITPEVTGTVSCAVYGYSECVTDGQQVLFQRSSGGD